MNVIAERGAKRRRHGVCQVQFGDTKGYALSMVAHEAAIIFELAMSEKFGTPKTPAASAIRPELRQTAWKAPLQRFSSDAALHLGSWTFCVP